MIGMPTKKTIVVPCSVMSWLKSCGGTRRFPGTASWRRISDASRPATTKKRSPEATYMIPRRLWSTVTTHSCRRAGTELRTARAGEAARVGSIDAMRSSLAQSQQVVDERVELLAGELHRRHERARLQRVRALEPREQVLAAHQGGAGRERLTAREVRQVRAEAPGGDGPAHAVAVDAGRRLEDAPPGHGRGVGHRGGALRRRPALEVRARVRDYAQEHVGVLRAAELRALPEVE